MPCLNLPCLALHGLTPPHLSRTVLGDCLVCTDNSAAVLFKPCLHMVTCEACAGVMKKCVECRAPIEEKVSFFVSCGGKQANRDRKVVNTAAGLQELASGAMALPPPPPLLPVLNSGMNNTLAAAGAVALPGAGVNQLAGQLAAASLGPTAAPPETNLVMNNGGRDTSMRDVQKLQQQLADIKEQVRVGARDEAPPDHVPRLPGPPEEHDLPVRPRHLPGANRYF